MATAGPSKLLKRTAKTSIDSMLRRICKHESLNQLIPCTRLLLRRHLVQIHLMGMVYYEMKS